MSEVRIDGWRNGVRFDAAHVIPGHPKCGRLHGHTYALHTSVEGETDERGFVVDFGELKSLLRSVADELDHRVLLAGKSRHYHPKEEGNSIVFQISGGSFRLPKENVRILPVEETSAEELSRFLLERMREGLSWPSRVRRIGAGIDEGYGKGAWTFRDLV